MRTKVRTFLVGLIVGVVLAGGGLSPDRKGVERLGVSSVHAVGGHGIRHAFTCTAADGSNAAKVNCSNWNAEHVLTALPFGTMTTPAAPIDGDCWTEASGTSPTRLLAWRCRDSGVTHTVASITY